MGGPRNTRKKVEEKKKKRKKEERNEGKTRFKTFKMFAN